MASRLELQTMLEEIIGSRNVYYQPPASIKMKYPAIVYSRNNIANVNANDSVYMQNTSYEIIVIDENPDSEIVKRVSLIPNCRFNTHFKTDNLNHDIFTLYY